MSNIDRHFTALSILILILVIVAGLVGLLILINAYFGQIGVTSTLGAMVVVLLYCLIYDHLK